MRSGIYLGKIFGIKIGLNWSWIFIFLLVTWDLAGGIFPLLHPEWSLGLRWGLGVAASILFFASVLAHELAHSLVARARGLPVDQIILFFFGGVSNIEKEPSSASTEFLMAFVGPLTSLVLGLFLTLAGEAFIGPGTNVAATPGEVLGGLGPLPTLLLWLGPVNIILGLFNLIPGFPMDGGRVLRSFLWAVTKNLRQATRYASLTGQGFGWLLMVVGVAMIFGVVIPVLGTGIFGGIWLIFIGWFLNNMAVQGYQQTVIEDVLKDVPVSAIMRSSFTAVPPETTIDNLVHQYILKTDERVFPVMMDGRFQGLICLDDVRRVPQTLWRSRSVGEVMTSEDKLARVSSEEKAVEALRKITARDVNQLPVLENGKLVGLISRRDILMWLQTHSEAGSLPRSIEDS